MSFLSQPISIIPIQPKRRIGDIDVQVVMEENTTDKLTITKQPVQQGASITDHSYLEPTTVTMTAFFKDNLTISLSKLYRQLLDLQASRIPFILVTPKRIYRNLLMGTVSQRTDAKTENCLAVSFAFEQVIIVKVSTTQVPRLAQKSPGETGATENAGKKSALLSLKEGIGALVNR